MPIGVEMDDIPLYNTRIIKSFDEYISKYHPQVDKVPIWDYAGITTYQLEDEGHWLTQKQVDRFYEILVKTTGDPDIARKVGQFTPFSQAAGKVSQYTLGFMTPAAAYTVLEKLYRHMSRGSTLQTKKVGTNTIEAVAIQNPGVKEKPYQCENRLGIFEGMAKLFTNELAKIEHHTCMHVDGNRCYYTIRWKEVPSFIWKRIVNYSLLFSLLTCPVLFFFLPVNSSVIAVLFSALIVMGLSLYQVHMEKDELAMTFKNHGDMASSLLDEINIRYNNAMLVHEIGQATSMILDSEKLLKLIMKAMENRLDFDRGMIMLSNQEKTRLIYTVGYGYNPEHEEHLTGIEFHLDNPHSKGPVIESFRLQKPLLIDDITQIETYLSRRSREFAKLMGAQSFICVPIIFESESMGILMVDNMRSKRNLRQSDVSLLMGIATQIAISMNNALSYQKVLESEERIRSLSENAPDIIYTLDINGAFNYINPAWEKILGHCTEEVIGRYFIDFITKEDISNVIHLFKQIRNEKRTITERIGTILHKDGSERVFNMSGAPNLDLKGNVIGIVGIFKDISEQKKLESQLIHAQKMEAIGTLAGGIAHDFNNLLMGIQGYASLMFLDINVCHPLYEKLKGIEDQVKSGADLTRQLLGLARDGKYEITMADLNEIIDKTSSMFGRTKKEISIHWKYEKDLWAVEIDRGQIEQVLLNMYVNAWQAMPGGGDLYLETANVVIDEEFVKPFSVNPGKYVKVSVTDTGIGMDQKTKERIFDPFFTTKEMGRGTGLGLSSAYGIIKGHNGIIHVYSEKGHGTTFTIYLPASDKKIIKQEDVSEDIVRGEGGILLVDDEEVITDVGKEILELLGYRVFIAKSGQEAIEIYKSRNDEIDLVILDMIMPGMGGGETFDVLKSIDPSIKVILSSGYSINVRPIKMLERGCDGFIQKPYSMNTLSQKIREVLDNKI
jgi:PAS domain S-box-containing protein